MDKNRNKALILYFVGSLVVVALTAFFMYGPFAKRDGGLADLMVSPKPLQWIDYVDYYTGFLLIPALYGLLSFFLIRRPFTKQAVGGYFIIALVIGVLFVLLSWIFQGLGQLDCSGHCGPDVMSPAATSIMTLLTIPPLVVVPAAYVYVCFRPARTSR